MPHRPPVLVAPAQPEGLRRNRHDSRVGVQHLHPITLQPGLVPDMLTAHGEEPRSGETALTLPRRELTHRLHPLERHAPAQRQRRTLPNASRVDVDQLAPVVRTRRSQRPLSVHRHPLSLKRPTMTCLNSTGRRQLGTLACSFGLLDRPYTITVIMVYASITGLPATCGRLRGDYWIIGNSNSVIRCGGVSWGETVP